MEVRIIGTSTRKYFDNFLMIDQKTKEIQMLSEGEKYYIIDKTNKNKIMKFNSRITMTQNIQVWTEMGFMNEKINSHYICIEISYKAAKEAYRKSLINNNSPIINIKTLAILYMKGLLNNQDLKKIGVSKRRGIFDIKKLKNEISKIELDIASEKETVRKIWEKVENEVN